MKYGPIAGQRSLGLLRIAFIALASSFFTGCLRHSPSTIPGAYRFQKFSDVTVLAPPGLVRTTGNTQETVIALEHKRRAQVVIKDESCVIDGSHFSLHPGQSDGHWRVTSPTPEAWNTPEIQASGEGEWLVFTNGIAILASHGCFPPDVSSYSVQRRIVEAIPIPADRALRFYYSLTSAGFVDLQPGMQLRIETVDPNRGKAASHTTQLSVIGLTPTGVALEPPAKRKETKAAEANSYRDLPQTFSEQPLLRLFLEQATTDTEHARKAILVGTRTSKEMDSETTALFRNNEGGCPPMGLAAVCTEFPNGSVSLLTSVTVNGRARFYAPGTTLLQMIDAVPEPQRTAAFASLSLARKYGAASVPILVPRLEEDLVNVLLINGDQVRWHLSGILIR